MERKKNRVNLYPFLVPFRLRLELQESRNDATRLRTDKKELEDKLVIQQRDYEKTLRLEKDQYSKLLREFKRSTDKLNRQLEESDRKLQQQHYQNKRASANAAADDPVYL